MITGANRHRWNTSFAWQRPNVTPRRLSDAQVDAFHRTGWLGVEDLLDAATLAALTADLPRHRDNGYAFVEPQQYLTIWLALTNATVENGCPWVALGEHHTGTLAHEWIHTLGLRCFDDHPAAKPAPVRAGGAVVFSSLTPHRTGPNTTDATRKTYILQYAPDGAVVAHGDPAAGPPERRVVQNDPERQYRVLRDGEPTGAAG